MCSEKTKDLLVKARKHHWVNARSDLVQVKGKGSMQCYWCKPKASDDYSSVSSRRNSRFSISQPEKFTFDVDRITRQVQWMTDMFEGMLNDIPIKEDCNVGTDDGKTQQPMLSIFPRDEVSETLVLPQKQSQSHPKNSLAIRKQVSQQVRLQLEQFITEIANTYRNNPFHSFEHASHVVMGTKKLLSRMITPLDTSPSSTAYGITADPLTLLAIVFSALIHDIDHPGVSNAQLVLEKDPVAIEFENKSVAEQNSVRIAWDLLMQPELQDLRNAMFPNNSDCKRFRQVVVNSVMATDLFDADLKLLREKRWQKAFDASVGSSDDDCNRRATIVIELIIQASDVSHTMQHWQVYQQWNKRLFLEMHAAYSAGRAAKDPTDGWYQGELWFFDNYIIPLAKKLKYCGVFGVSCDELLDYAMDNREEWALKGEAIVANLVLETLPSLDEGDSSVQDLSEICISFVD